MIKSKQASKFGRVVTVADGVVYGVGCELSKAGEQIYFSKGVFGLLMNLESNKLGILLFGRDNLIVEGDLMCWTGQELTVQVGAARTGFIGDGLGNSLVPLKKEAKFNDVFKNFVFTKFNVSQKDVYLKFKIHFKDVNKNILIKKVPTYVGVKQRKSKNIRKIEVAKAKTSFLEASFNFLLASFFFSFDSFNICKKTKIKEYNKVKLDKSKRCVWWQSILFLKAVLGAVNLHGESYIFRRRIRRMFNEINISLNKNISNSTKIRLPLLHHRQIYKNTLDSYILADDAIRQSDFSRNTDMWWNVKSNKKKKRLDLNLNIPSINKLEKKRVESKAPGIIKRTTITESLETGIKVIDSMVPIGKGQRELVLGDRQTGKSAICIDTIIHQSRESRRKFVGSGSIRGMFNAIYVAIGQKMSTVKRIVRLFKVKNCWRNVSVIASTSSSAMGFQFVAPYTGTSLGEYWRDLGMDSLIVYDDLSKHANIYRQISLLLGRPPGREAYPGDVFYLHSRLLERAAKMVDNWTVWRCGLTALWKWEQGVVRLGGTLTALPIAETIEGDVSAYIPTNLISITDGQIVLDTNLFKRGVRPAVNLGLSVSRVGSMAQSKMMKFLAKDLKLELAQYREVEDFAKFGSSLDEGTANLINKGQRLIETTVQKNKMPMKMDDQLVVLYSASKGYLDGIDVSQVNKFEKFVCRLILAAGLFGKDEFKDNLRRPLVKLNETKIKTFLEVSAAWFSNQI